MPVAKNQFFTLLTSYRRKVTQSFSEVTSVTAEKVTRSFSEDATVTAEKVTRHPQPSRPSHNGLKDRVTFTNWGGYDKTDERPA